MSKRKIVRKVTSSRKSYSSLTHVTGFSKMLAVIIFFIFILFGMYLGMRYQRIVDVQNFMSSQLTPTQTPSLYFK